jgi:hypothetical protein
MFQKQALLNPVVYLSGPTQYAQRPVLQVCALLRTCRISQSDLIQEVFARSLASHLDIHCLETHPESPETCDNKITTGVETSRNEIIKDRTIVVAATVLEVTSRPVVNVSLLNAAISVGARNATILQETM